MVWMCLLIMPMGACMTEQADGLYTKIMSVDLDKDAAKAREWSEQFVVKYPQDDRVHQIRIKLLESYIASSKFSLADAYSERLLQGVLLPKQYQEDVRYLRIQLLVKKSQHWVALLLKQQDVFRNIEELGLVEQRIQQFFKDYPNTEYREALESTLQIVREAQANYHLSVAKHYLKKGNFDAANQRVTLYFEQYSDIDSPLLEELYEHPEIN